MSFTFILVTTILVLSFSSQNIDCVDPSETLRHSDHLDIIREAAARFANRTLIVTVVVREPFVIYNEPLGLPGLQEDAIMLAQSDPDNYSGVAVEVVKRLAAIFRMNLKFKRPKDNQFGVYLAEQKLWTGLMGDLVKEEADIAVTALSITMSRAQAIDFTRAYYVETVAILLRSPEEVENYFVIFEPFSTTVWLVLSFTIVVLIFLVTIMTELEEKQLQQEEKAHELQISLIGISRRNSHLNSSETESNLSPRHVVDENHKHHTEIHPFGASWLERFYYAVTCVINILLNRDIKHPPRQSPIRLLVCVWWLSTIVIVNLYLGILFGQLVVPHRPKSIDTLEELVSQSAIEWAVTQGSAIYELFRKSDRSTVYGRVGERMRNVSTADEGVRRVVHSGWAYIRERSILTFKVAQEHNRMKLCRMQFAREEFYSIGFGLGLVKNSTYLRAFNSALTLMIENGFVSHWESMYWPKKNQYTECSEKATEGQPLTLKHFVSIYLVCSLIISFSALVLAYQNLHKHFFYSSAGKSNKSAPNGDS